MRSRTRLPLLVVLGLSLLAGCGLLTPPPPATDGIRPPASVEVGTGPVPYAGTARWTDAAAPSPRSRRLTILAFGEDESGGGYCGPPVLRLLARETPHAVHLLVARYQIEHVDQPTQCAPLSGRPTPHVLRLSRPLGSRTLIDGVTREARPVRLASR